jgi:hypothetical protein
MLQRKKEHGYFFKGGFHYGPKTGIRSNEETRQKSNDETKGLDRTLDKKTTMENKTPQFGLSEMVTRLPERAAIFLIQCSLYSDN